ncbi:hypothetical protein E3U55_06140 [Filobacillus milosensis]|uniref:Uncharacterized protein n=1 Tax=Filobacillus milosensis TaxID=94137 RepID=A0A4Y8IQS4_9BACI|nr:hypothetical protein [Filobacillus milosensis]TFB22814.1 hypothetical protein E3U55_06140 [Filobacillus milosensis]
MDFSHQLVIFFVIAVIAFVLRFVQIKTMARVDLYIFVFGPLLVFGLIFLIFGMIDFKRELFLDIGKWMFLYGVVGAGCGYGSTRVLGGRF